MVSRSPEGRDRVPQYVLMIGDPLALRIHTPLGRATPEQVAAVAGSGPSYYKLGNRVRYRWHEVQAWADACRERRVSGASRPGTRRR